MPILNHNKQWDTKKVSLLIMQCFGTDWRIYPQKKIEYDNKPTPDISSVGTHRHVFFSYFARNHIAT
uniref:Uncharacterized protein n=1 Tax=Rhizophora mucronata TaxID=61149 RepID=A0A2P2ITG4_RHIMU